LNEVSDQSPAKICFGQPPFEARHQVSSQACLFCFAPMAANFPKQAPSRAVMPSALCLLAMILLPPKRIFYHLELEKQTG